MICPTIKPILAAKSKIHFDLGKKYLATIPQMTIPIAPPTYCRAGGKTVAIMAAPRV
jgi:hypothetical protein